jgi:hypothetical protein
MLMLVVSRLPPVKALNKQKAIKTFYKLMPAFKAKE